MSADFWQFVWAHPFVTWLIAWGIWPICWAAQAILTAPFRYPFLAWNRYLRSKNIRAHGWPTNPNMDADGDVVSIQRVKS